jgi:hypothetical protein
MTACGWWRGWRGRSGGSWPRWGIETLAGLARYEGRLEPEHVSRERIEKVRAQARVQMEGRRRGEAVQELLPLEAGRGLARLPAPSAGDLFFDLEGGRSMVIAGPGREQHGTLEHEIVAMAR